MNRHIGTRNNRACFYLKSIFLQVLSCIFVAISRFTDSWSCLNHESTDSWILSQSKQCNSTLMHIYAVNSPYYDAILYCWHFFLWIRESMKLNGLNRSQRICNRFQEYCAYCKHFKANCWRWGKGIGEIQKVMLIWVLLEHRAHRHVD